jgi:outer membrane protein TolC
MSSQTNIRPFLNTLLIWLFCTVAPAGALQLQEAVDMAMAQSPYLAISKSKSSETEWKRTEAFSTFLPSVTTGVNYLLDYRYAYTDIAFGGAPVSVPQIIPTTSYFVNAQYELFDGLAGTRHWLATRAEADAAQDQYQWERFTLERKVELQFYKVLAARTLKGVAEQNLKTLEDHLKDIHLVKRAGAATNYDVLRVEVQVSQARSELLNAEDSIQIELGNLAESLGQEKIADVQGTLPDLDASWIDGAKLENVTNRLDLKASSKTEEAFDLEAKAAKSHWVPKVSAFWNYQSYNNRNDEYDDWRNFRDAYTVGLNVTWNLFDGFGSTARAGVATEHKFQEGKQAQILKLKSKQDFDIWRRKYIYNCTNYKVRLTEISKAKESVRLAKEGRRVGARTNTEMLDAEADLYRSQAGAVTAQMNAIEALIHFELTTGQKFFVAK